MTERKENQMSTNRKVLTGLAVLIVLSLLAMPASVFAQSGAEGAARTYKVTKSWKTRRMNFNVMEGTDVYRPFGSMWVFNAKCNNLIWSIPKVKCVTIEDGTAYFAGRGRGKMRGKYVLVVARADRGGVIEVRTTRSRRYFKYWCGNPSRNGLPYTWAVDKGFVNVGP
jgi:hypothetical protein